MSEFKVGDRVRVGPLAPSHHVGREGEVVEVRVGPFLLVRLDRAGTPSVSQSHAHQSVHLLHPRELERLGSLAVTTDPINHPDHYKWLPVEAIEITEHFNFCMGNALKYILRADRKGKPIEDLKKAIWYLEREIANRESAD